MYLPRPVNCSAVMPTSRFGNSAADQRRHGQFIGKSIGQRTMQIPGKHIPLTIAHLTGYTSPNSNALSRLMYSFERSDVVRAYGFSSSHVEVLRMLDEGKVNTITIDLRYFSAD